MSIALTRRPPLYFEALRGACRLYISEHHGDAASGQAVRIGIESAEKFHDEITACEHKRLGPGINEVPWGFKEISITDPFYNRLIFCERV